jgi:hypothetical protein
MQTLTLQTKYSAILYHQFIRADGGSPLAGELSSLSRSAGNVFALPGELDLFLNDDTPQNNKPALSGIADLRRNSPYTSDSKPRPKAK